MYSRFACSGWSCSRGRRVLPRVGGHGGGPAGGRKVGDGKEKKNLQWLFRKWRWSVGGRADESW